MLASGPVNRGQQRGGGEDLLRFGADGAGVGFEDEVVPATAAITFPGLFMASGSAAGVAAQIEASCRPLAAIKDANAQSGGLTTEYSGPLPNIGGYTPMHQEGAIILGTGGDNSNESDGSFYEGVVTAGYPSAATGNAVQANVVSAGYQLQRQ